MTLFELLDYCADPAHRFDAVDVTGYYFPNYSASEATVPSDKFVDELKTRASDLGLPISGTGVGNSFTGVPFDREGKNGGGWSTDEGGDRAKIEKDIERIKAWIEIAARLGAPVLRVFSGLEPSYLMKEHISPDDPEKEEKAGKLKAWRTEAFKRMAEDLGVVTEYGRQFGVIIGIQNHGDFLRTADETIELLAAVNSKWLGCIVDTGYFLTPDPYVDIEKVMPYGVNFQIKEYARVSPSDYMTPEFRPIQLNRLMEIVRRSDYRGYLPIETLSAGKTERYDPYKEIPPFLKQVREAIKATA
jgi:sugar phosphate isomerase/epimerase